MRYIIRVELPISGPHANFKICLPNIALNLKVKQQSFFSESPEKKKLEDMFCL